MSASDVVAEEYASSLSDLVANSKPLINMLTMLAEENIDHAPAIVQAVERHLQQVRSDIKLPVLYLIDSIVKNVRQAYTGLFTQNIVSTFCSVFEKVDEKTRAQMFKLRQTWNDVFPQKKLYAMDVRVSSIDPAWPITAPAPTTSIHINPKFFPKQGNQAPIVSPLQSGTSSAPLAAPVTGVNVPEDPQAIAEAKMREQLLKRQKKLLELQQKKLEIELLQTKAKLEEQQKQLERQTDHLHVQQLLLPALQSVGQDAASKLFGSSLLVDIASSSLGVKTEHATQPTNSAQASGGHQVVVAPASSAVSSSTGASRSPSKIKTEVTTSKVKAAGKPAAGPGGNSSRSRDPRLATRQPVPSQPNVVTNVTSENLQQPVSQLAPTQDNTNSVFETVKLETAKPKPQITINIANKGNSNKESQGVSKKDPRLNSNKVHVSNSKIRSESKNSGPSKGPNKSTRGPSPLPAPQSPSRCGKPAPLPRKAHGKGSSSSTNKSSHKSTNVIDLTDSPPHKTSEKKEEELAGKDKDSHSEPLSKSSSSSSSSGSNSSSSPGSKKDSHKSKSSSASSRQSPSEKKKGSEKGGKASEVGSGSTLSNRRVKSPAGGSRRSRERERDRSVSKKFDMFEPEADSPSPPPPPVISDNQKREDTTFKDVKVSKKGRNYVRRNRQDESRSPEVSTVSSGDVDLRLGAPPEKHPRMGAFPADGTSSSTEDDAKKTLVDATTKDVDLRQLSRSPTKKRSSMERSDQPPNKKSKAEMIDVLFGNEDVDLRQLTPISVVTQQGMPPSPPPPPIISQPSPTQSVSNQDSSVASNSPKIKTEVDKDIPSESKSDLEDSHRVKENGEGKSFRGWEKYKESKPDIYKSPFRPHKLEPSHKSTSPARDSMYNSRDRGIGHFNRHVGDRMEYDGLGRPLLYHRFQEMGLDRRHRHGQNAMSSPIGEDTDMRTHLLDPDSLEDVDVNISIIIHQADEQLKNGSMSFPEYNTLLKQVIRLNEMQKLREAQRRDRQENKESWERNRRRAGEMGKASPRSEDENSRDSLPGGRYGDIDERFPVLKRAQQPSSVSSPPDPQWNDVAPHHGRPGMWEQHPPPWARGMGPSGSMGPMPGPQFPRMMHGGPFHRQPGPGQDFPPGPNSFGPMTRWRPGQFNRPPFEGEMDGRPRFRFEQFNMRFPRGGGGGPQPPLAQQQQPPPPPPQLQSQPLPQTQPQPLPQQQQQPPVQSQPLQQPTPQQLANGELPLADPILLEAIAQDSMRTINIDGVPREIRFYGDTAVVMLSWDDPREIGFQGGTRCISFDERETILCSFNEPYREFVLDGCTHRIRLGAPTRELYVDGKWYECFFGGPPVSVEMGGKIRLVKLEGPPPQVKIGMIKRTDLVAGKINLIINARNMVPIFLDAKPQRFDIEGKPHILRFTHALTNVQINGKPFKVEFGGLPKPIVVRDKKHFIRFSVLPRGIQPGYINIVNMEGERLPSPVHADGEAADTSSFSPPDENDEAKLRKVNEPALPMLGRSRQRRFGTGQDSPNDPEPARNSPATVQPDGAAPKLNQPVTSQLPLEMLTSLMPVAMAPSSGYSYQVEQESQDPQQRTTSDASIIPVSNAPLATAAVAAVAAGDTSTVKTAEDGTVPLAAVVAPSTSTGLTAAGIPFLLPEINVDELFQKLVATGIVAPSVGAEESKKKKEEDADTVKFVDFSQPETLKVRQPALIAALYSGIQCSSCGVRFAPEQTMKYSQHLDWHFRQNRRDRDNTRKAQSRKWYYDISDWIQFEEIEDLEERAQSWFETQQAAEGRAEEKEPMEVPSVPAGDSAEDTVCDVCHDKFEQFYNEETEEWHLRLAIRMEGKTYHPLCYEDLKTNLERSLDESVTTEEIKQEETEKEGEKTDEKPIENDSEDKKNAEEKETDKEMDSSVPVDSTDQELEGLSIALKQEISIKEEVASQEEIENLNSEIKTEEAAECDSTIVKSEEADADMPMEEETAATVPVVPKVDTTHTEVACSIDGNVKFEDKPQTGIAGPISGKIKINITKSLPVPVREAQSEGDAESSAAEGDADDTDEAPPPPLPPPSPQMEGLAVEIKDVAKEPTLEQEFPEPPPPGIEPVRLKPRLVGRKLTELPPVMKGTELSGLCSIM